MRRRNGSPDAADLVVPAEIRRTRTQLSEQAHGTPALACASSAPEAAAQPLSGRCSTSGWVWPAVRLQTDLFEQVSKSQTKWIPQGTPGNDAHHNWTAGLRKAAASRTWNDQC
jgi:hypothetical protein